MKKLIIEYGDFILKVHASIDNTHIKDSYKVKRIKDMKGILLAIQHELEGNDMAINNRSIDSMINEWRVHNLFYSLSIKKDRTKSVDLDINQPWYIKLGYKVLSIFYLHF